MQGFLICFSFTWFALWRTYATKTLEALHALIQVQHVIRTITSQSKLGRKEKSEALSVCPNLPVNAASKTIGFGITISSPKVFPPFVMTS